MSDTKQAEFPLKNILCIRADNIGDLLMSTPAFRALKETFDCKITVLTSRMGSLIAPFIPYIDDTIIADVPWVKTDASADETALIGLIETLTRHAFDTAVIFTVYSQNPLPAAMLALMSGIKTRLAYCRENPYQLLTHWLPEEEPYSFIQHQVERDVNLVAALGAFSSDKTLSVFYNKEIKKTVIFKLNQIGADFRQAFIIFHPGVSEEKRKYPSDLWIECGKKCLQNGISQIIITGSSAEEKEAKKIQTGIGEQCFSTAGLFSVEELIALIDLSQLLVSVNTGTVHIAASLQKPVAVLYALTNPQHTPWQTSSQVLYFSVKEELRSKNQVVKYVTDNLMQKDIDYPAPEEVWKAVCALLAENNTRRTSIDTFS